MWQVYNYTKLKVFFFKEPQLSLPSLLMDNNDQTIVCSTSDTGLYKYSTQQDQKQERSVQSLYLRSCYLHTLYYLFHQNNVSDFLSYKSHLQMIQTGSKFDRGSNLKCKQLKLTYSFLQQKYLPPKTCALKIPVHKLLYQV